MTACVDADVIVVGSIHVDHSLRVAELPVPGETVIASDVKWSVGGKGANQAIAAARLGARVHMVGAVGADENAERALATLNDENVDVSAVQTHHNRATGMAYISVAQSGENAIVVHSGASAALTERDVARALEGKLAHVDDAIVLVQGETPQSVISTVAAAAVARAQRFVLNLAPAIPVPQSILAVADPLIVNEGEARAVYGRLFGEPAADRSESELLAALATCCRSVVMTLGERGAMTLENGELTVIEPPTADQVVDTTGAGDALVGALVAALAHGEGFRAATRWGVHYGTLAVSGRGASASYASFPELAHSLARQPVPRQM